jgi:Raf kinase inhibitor-like YbhB/YbcL family protein
MVTSIIRRVELIFAMSKRRHKPGGAHEEMSHMTGSETFPITKNLNAPPCTKGARVGLCLTAAGFLFATLSVQALAFELTSPNVKPGGVMPEKFVFNGLGCHGGNLSPALSWTNPPEGTKSFALMVHDPDAQTGGAGIWHWVVVNIPATARSIAEGAGTADGAKLPAGSHQVTNDYAGLTNSPGWGGPCPAKGVGPHQYNFTLYALKVEKLDLPPNATSSQAGFFANLNALGKATLTMSYGG